MQSTTTRYTAPSLPCQDGQPWCTDHANGTPPNRPPHPDDQLCQTRIGKLVMSAGADHGPRIFTFNLPEELTVAEARAVARQLLELAKLADGR